MNLTADNIDKGRNPLHLLMVRRERATGRLDQVLAPYPRKTAVFLLGCAAVLLLVGISVELLMYIHPSLYFFGLFFERLGKLIYNRTASRRNRPQAHSQDGRIVEMTTVPLTAATAAVAMEDVSIHTYLDTTAITTIIPIITAITETAIITSTTALVWVMAGRRIADTVTELITPMPDDEVKVLQ